MCGIQALHRSQLPFILRQRDFEAAGGVALTRTQLQDAPHPGQRYWHVPRTHDHDHVARALYCSLKRSHGLQYRGGRFKAPCWQRGANELQPNACVETLRCVRDKVLQSKTLEPPAAAHTGTSTRATGSTQSHARTRHLQLELLA